MRIVEAQPAIKRSYPRCDYRKRRNRLAALKKKPRRAWEACEIDVTYRTSLFGIHV